MVLNKFHFMVVTGLKRFPCSFVSSATFRKSGFTIVETLISLTLLAALFILLGSLMSGMASLSARVEDYSTISQEVNFCFEMIRKELSEAVINKLDDRCKIFAGDNFFSYVTLREELIARDSVSRGAKAVEWRFETDRRVLTRKVWQLPETGTEMPLESTEDVLAGLSNIEIFLKKDEDLWERVAGISEIMDNLRAIRLIFYFDENSEIGKQVFQTTFWIPEGNAFYAGE